MTTKQLSIFDKLGTATEKRAYKQRFIHGGESSVGKRKLRRPIATKRWMHLVLKSKKATAQYSLLNQRNVKQVDLIVRQKAKKFGVELKDFVNMGNHIHFQIRVRSREGFQSFLRAITCLLARVVTGAARGNPFGKFWDGLAFTRIVNTLEEVTRFEGYLTANKIERKHGYQARVVYLSALNAWIKKLKAQGIHQIMS